MFIIRTLIDCPTFEDALRENGVTFPQGKESVLHNVLQGFQESPAPRFVQTLGFVGSGKSTLIKEFIAKHPNYLSVAFDAIMEDLPQYRDDRATLGNEAAFARWELPARALGYDLLEAAINRRLNIILEHSGARADHVALLSALKATQGYTVALIDTLCDPALAIIRARSRADARPFPDSYVFERKTIVDTLKPEYRAIADEWSAFDTNGARPVLMDS